MVRPASTCPFGTARIAPTKCLRSVRADIQGESDKCRGKRRHDNAPRTADQKKNNEQLYQQRSPSEHPHIELRDSMHHRNLLLEQAPRDGQHQTYCERYQCQRDGYRQPRNQQFREGTDDDSQQSVIHDARSSYPARFRRIRTHYANPLRTGKPIFLLLYRNVLSKVLDRQFLQCAILLQLREGIVQRLHQVVLTLADREAAAGLISDFAAICTSASGFCLR